MIWTEGLFTSPAKTASRPKRFTRGDGPEMRCFFHLVNDHEEIVDNTGIEVQDLESAKVQALLAITELRQEIGADIEDWSGWRLDIVCPQGTLLHSMLLNNTVH